MTDDPLPALLAQVNSGRLGADLRYLAHDPLPYRKLNYTRPGQSRCSLYEADEYIAARLTEAGYAVRREGVTVQAFRCDPCKPKAHQYSPPHPDDRTYTAYNLYAERAGAQAEGIVLLLAHKDSQSWVDSPGANDNAVGTAALLEIARMVTACRPRATIRFLFCNEEHTPWTSVTAAEKARERGDRLLAIFNLDGLGRGTPEDREAGRHTNVTLFTEDEGEPFADLMTGLNRHYGLGLAQRKQRRERPGDDDGSFVKAGFRHAVINIGSYPYGDPAYHTEQDVIDHVDLDALVAATRLSGAAAVHVARTGGPAL